MSSAYNSEPKNLKPLLKKYPNNINRIDTEIERLEKRRKQLQKENELQENLERLAKQFQEENELYNRERMNEVLKKRLYSLGYNKEEVDLQIRNRTGQNTQRREQYDNNSSSSTAVSTIPPSSPMYVDPDPQTTFFTMFRKVFDNSVKLASKSVKVANKYVKEGIEISKHLINKWLILKKPFSFLELTCFGQEPCQMAGCKHRGRWGINFSVLPPFMSTILSGYLKNSVAENCCCFCAGHTIFFLAYVIGTVNSNGLVKEFGASDSLKVDTFLSKLNTEQDTKLNYVVESTIKKEGDPLKSFLPAVSSITEIVKQGGFSSSSSGDAINILTEIMVGDPEAD